MRKYKHDLSDLIGIIEGERTAKKPLVKENIMNAYIDMYANEPDEKRREYLDAIYATADFKELYQSVTLQEQEDNIILKQFEQDYPGVLSSDSINRVLNSLKERENKTDR